MEAISSFIEYLRFEKRYSKHSLIAYEIDLKQWVSYLNSSYEVTQLEQVQVPFIRSWLVSMMENGLSARSINRKITALKSFYKYALRSGWVQINPMGKISSPKIPKRLPVYVEADKLDLLLDQTEFSDDFEGIRNHLILEMFYGTGMRLSELIELELRDVDTRNLQLKVTGKRNKQRILPLFPSLAHQINKYLEMRNALTSSTSHFFITPDGKSLYPILVYRLVNKYLTKVSTQKKRSPHVLRHSFATEMLNKGADLNAIKEILGHANLSATQVYTHNTIEKLKVAYLQAHPRA
ncbi:MAG TPA: tyrosine-type recombinase/integrase [Flavobacteriales bacterium]|nr:tyrosine-type recombinase/integrase [Flavobacteriales bacterium]